MNVKLLGAHCGESQNAKFLSILIDETVAIDAGGLTSSLSFQVQQELKAILLTHQHLDHIIDILAIGIYLESIRASINVYSIPSVHDALINRLLSRHYLEKPDGNPPIKFNLIEPLKSQQIEDYSVLAVPVNHRVPAVGYQLTSPSGKALFYTGDTGPDLTECWKQISPQLLFIETTLPNRLEEAARTVGHLTPALVKQELAIFRQVKGYLPQVVIVHMLPAHEEEIKAEISAVEKDLNHPLAVGYEGMQIRL